MIVLDKLWNYAMLRWKKVKHGKGLRINGRICIHGEKGNIQIGNNCVINSNENSNSTANGTHSHLVTRPNGKIVVGNNVGMSQVNITAFEYIEIEDNVLIGSCVKIWDTDFHSLNYDERLRDENPKCSPVLIKEGAFIGACSIILKGVTIGKHSVIGAGSVVAVDIPDGEVWAGNPARYIKSII